eukprot:4485205-Lingulodinium_polyedra.AAC.1
MAARAGNASARGSSSGCPGVSAAADIPRARPRGCHRARAWLSVGAWPSTRAICFGNRTRAARG